MLDYGYYIIGGQTLLYILATLYLTRRLRLKARENLQLSGEVSGLKFKLWNAETKLKNARDHITLLESSAEAFLRRECTYIKNRNKPTDEVMQLKSDNDSLRERLMKSESDRRHLEEKVLTLTRGRQAYDTLPPTVVVEGSAMNFAMSAECKRLEKELALRCMQIKDLEESNSQLYAKSVEKSDECAERKRESQMFKSRWEEVVSTNKRLDDKLREQRSTIQWLQASLSVKPTASDLHAISVQKDSLLNQVSVLRTENFSLKAKLSMVPNGEDAQKLRAVNKDLTYRLQAMYDANLNKYEEYLALSDEVGILKRRIADLLKENDELKAEHLLW